MKKNTKIKKTQILRNGIRTTLLKNAYSEFKCMSINKVMINSRTAKDIIKSHEQNWVVNLKEEFITTSTLFDMVRPRENSDDNSFYHKMKDISGIRKISVAKKKLETKRKITQEEEVKDERVSIQSKTLCEEETLSNINRQMSKDKDDKIGGMSMFFMTLKEKNQEQLKKNIYILHKICWNIMQRSRESIENCKPQNSDEIEEILHCKGVEIEGPNSNFQVASDNKKAEFVARPRSKARTQKDLLDFKRNPHQYGSAIVSKFSEISLTKEIDFEDKDNRYSDETNNNDYNNAKRHTDFGYSNHFELKFDVLDSFACEDDFKGLFNDDMHKSVYRKSKFLELSDDDINYNGISIQGQGYPPNRESEGPSKLISPYKNLSDKHVVESKTLKEERSILKTAGRYSSNHDPVKQSTNSHPENLPSLFQKKRSTNVYISADKYEKGRASMENTINNLILSSGGNFGYLKRKSINMNDISNIEDYLEDDIFDLDVPNDALRELVKEEDHYEDTNYDLENLSGSNENFPKQIFENSRDSFNNSNNASDIIKESLQFDEVKDTKALDNKETDEIEYKKVIGNEMCEFNTTKSSISSTSLEFNVQEINQL